MYVAYNKLSKLDEILRNNNNMTLCKNSTTKVGFFLLLFENYFYDVVMSYYIKRTDYILFIILTPDIEKF